MGSGEQMITENRQQLREVRLLQDGPEWMPARKFPRSVRVLIVLVGSGLGWGVAIGLVVMAMEWVR